MRPVLVADCVLGHMATRLLTRLGSTATSAPPREQSFCAYGMTSECAVGVQAVQVQMTHHATPHAHRTVQKIKDILASTEAIDVYPLNFNNMVSMQWNVIGFH